MKEDQRKIVVTIDLAGRQIVQEENVVQSALEDEDEDLVDYDYLDTKTEKRAGTFQNPFLATAKPSFRKSNRSRPKDFLKSEGIKQKSQ